MRQDVAVREVVLDSSAHCWHCGIAIAAGLPALDVREDGGLRYYVAVDHGEALNPPLPAAPYRAERFDES